MIKAVLFDMDGVLYDSMPSHAQAWYETMIKRGIPCSSEEFYMYEGRTGTSTIDLLFNRTFGRDATQEEKNIIYSEKSNRFNELDSSNMMPGALSVLKETEKYKLINAIVTGSGQTSLFDKIDSNFPNSFSKERMVTAYDVKFGKPHPEPYLMGLEKVKATAAEAIVVENAPLGVEAAVAAGIYTIAVNTGPLPDRVLLDVGANCIYPSMQALADDFGRLIDEIQSNS